jgi:hypothetical protein
MKHSNGDFNWAGFHRRRKLYKLAGLILALWGVYTLVDMMGEIPTAFRGEGAVVVGVGLIVFGLLALYHGFKLPLEEALDLVHRKGRGITESEIVHDMRVDRVTARRIIDGLIQKGFLRRASEQANATDEVFEPVK